MFTGLLVGEYHDLHMKMNRKVCNKTRSPPASLLFKGQGTEHTTVKWSITKFKGPFEMSSWPSNPKPTVFELFSQILNTVKQRFLCIFKVACSRRSDSRAREKIHEENKLRGEQFSPRFFLSIYNLTRSPPSDRCTIWTPGTGYLKNTKEALFERNEILSIIN